MRRNSAFLAAAVVFSLLPFSLYAQNGGGGGAATAPPANAKAAAPVDLTGQWMSIVTEDWRYRMILPHKGDYDGVPLSVAAKKVADDWDPAKDEAAEEQCRSYGAAAVMRAPGRIRISWADESTLKVETDSGTQTRLLYFKDPKTQGGDWQGVSQASWETMNTRNGTERTKFRKHGKGSGRAQAPGAQRVASGGHHQNEARVPA